MKVFKKSVLTTALSLGLTASVSVASLSAPAALLQSTGGNQTQFVYSGGQLVQVQKLSDNNTATQQRVFSEEEKKVADQLVARFLEYNRDYYLENALKTDMPEL